MLIGERLQEIRKDAGIKQKQLAEILSVAEKTISGYENERISPSDEIKIAIAKYFDVSFDYLIGLTDERVSYDRSTCICMPPNAPKAFQKELKDYFEVLKIKHKIK